MSKGKREGLSNGDWGVMINQPRDSLSPIELYHKREKAWKKLELIAKHVRIFERKTSYDSL